MFCGRALPAAVAYSKDPSSSAGPLSRSEQRAERFGERTLRRALTVLIEAETLWNERSLLKYVHHLLTLRRAASCLLCDHVLTATQFRPVSFAIQKIARLPCLWHFATFGALDCA
jgi:hypothetical protein